MPKATLSEDGQYRIDMRVEFRVSLGDVASYLASALRPFAMERLPSIAKGLTAKQVRDLARTEMKRRGTDFIDGWADDFGTVETNERLACAEDLARKAYPELAKAEESKRPPLEPLVTKMCQHGNAPREDVTGDPIAECVKADGGTVFGAFNPEGCFYAYDCAVDVANEAAKESATEDDITWGRKCREHEDEPENGCTECYKDDSEETTEDAPRGRYAGVDLRPMLNRKLADPETVTEIYAARCVECKGFGCPQCAYTGQKNA